MLQLNDLLPPAQWEANWTFYGDDHEGLPKNAVYVVFEYYCINPKCTCESLKAEIMQLDVDGEPIKKSLAIIYYNWSSTDSKCDPCLDEQSPKTVLALNLLEVYKKFIESDEYLSRIKKQYAQVKRLGIDIELKKQAFVKNNPTNKNIGHNAKCPCGSNKKYKQCCLRYNTHQDENDHKIC